MSMAEGHSAYVTQAGLNMRLLGDCCVLLYCTVHVCHFTGGTALSVSRLSGGTIASVSMWH